jgi:hypothetical protein
VRLIRLVPLLLMALALSEPAAAVPADYDWGEQEGCGMEEMAAMVWIFFILPFVVCPMFILWHRLLDNLFRGVAIGKLPTKPPLGKRREKLAYILTGLAICAAIVLIKAPEEATSVVSFGLPAWPLIWAAIFAPWFLLRHWAPGRRGRLCPTRAMLVGLCAFGLAGWIYLVSPWL